MNMLILSMIQKNYTGPYYRVQALLVFMYGVLARVRAVGLTFVQLEAKNSLDQSAY